MSSFCLFISSIIRSSFLIIFIENEWPCSPELSWMYNWSKSLSDPKAIQNSSSISCDADGKPYSLLLVMGAYTEEVLPSCPRKKGCTCIIKHINKPKIDVNGDIIMGNYFYTVQVLCIGKNLTHFPKHPDCPVCQKC